VDAPGTVDAYLIGLRDIAVFMAARGVRGGANALTRAVLAEYWLQAGGMRELSAYRLMCRARYGQTCRGSGVSASNALLQLRACAVTVIFTGARAGDGAGRGAVA
jgi:hypothetical protein